MTQEQFEQAVRINRRLNGLEKVKEEIKSTDNNRLTYSNKSCSGSWDLCSPYIMRLIDEILDKHDLMIREEIDKEIETLKKEIETL